MYIDVQMMPVPLNRARCHVRDGWDRGELTEEL